ncbi:MAG TPA: amino acid adenylation domain-containing protein [Longimicrobiaceae bacterium]|nr:amino acid adenylation domain-containing protein [Longimicrobiaceae bacterium]
MSSIVDRLASLSPERRRLLLRLLEEKRGGADAPEEIGRRSFAGPAPLSFAQQRLWFLDRLAPGSAAYNMFQGLRMRGPLDVAALRGSLAWLVRRHETLRTVFREVDGEPMQVVLPPARPPLPWVDLGGLAPAAREAETRRLAAAESVRPFALGGGPLLRAAALRLGPEDHALFFTLHHAVSDGWSMGVLVAEVSATYGALTRGAEPALPELPVQYADYAAWQRRWLAGETLERQLAYWRGRLAGAPPVIALPTDRPRRPAQGEHGASRRVFIPAEVVQGLRTLARERGATLFTALLAGWQLLLARWCGEDDVVVGSPYAGRTRVELEPLIGFFANTLALRTELGGDPTAREAVRRAWDTVLGAQAHQDLPFERLVEELAPDRSLEHTPLFQVAFALQNVQQPALEIGAVKLEPLGGEEAAKFDLSLTLSENNDAVRGALFYRTELFDAATVERLVERFGAFLAAMAADPERRLSALPLLLPDERWLLDAEWGASRLSHAPAGLVPDLVALRAAEAPDAPAVDSAAGSLTYGELLAGADALASRLRALGVGPETRVAVCLERTPRLVTTLLAVLRSGAAYVALDPAYPSERTAWMLEDSGARVVVTEEGWEDRFADFEGRVVVPSPPGALPEGAGPERGPSVSPDALAYVIYTSGSTGRPKGVMISHRNAAAFVHWMRGAVSDEEREGVLFSSSASFDVSVAETFATLCWGGRVVVVENALELVRLSEADGVRLASMVPSAAAELLRMGGIPPTVRSFNLGGEALPPELAEGLYALGHVERVRNLYGPTEDTTYSTCEVVGRGAERVTVGRPVAGTRGYVLDPWLQPVPPGVPGELYLAGVGVTRGYQRRPELTAARYLPDPFPAEPGGRMYRTGDRVRRGADGALEYLGRTDFQVKIRGFRVEPGEVEATLAAAPGVREAAVTVREDASGGKGLAAYVVAREGAAPEPAELRAWLRERLPEHMVPATVTVLERFPLNPNGKTDRAALPAPDGAGEEEHDAPRTPTEELLAGIWAETLGVERVGVRTGFFDLGGHSLLATRVVSRVREAFGVELPLRVMFEAPTVAELAALVDSEAGEGAAAGAPPVVPVPRDGPLPLSFAQQRLWFIHRLDPSSAAYNVPLPLRLRGALEPATLARAVDEIVRRHESLRTVFRSVDGRAVQVVSPAARARLAQVDLRALPPAEREAAARWLAAEDAARPFDLERGPLLRVTLVRLDEADWALLLDMHHVVSDAWSVEVLVREASALYAAFGRGEPSPLPPLPVQYADFAAWQRAWLTGEVLDRQLAYWRERLAGAPPVLDLPTDRPRPPVPTPEAARRPFVLSGEASAALRALGRAEGTTLFMTLLAGWQALLGRYAATDDVVVGAPIAGRTRRETEGLIGFFVNTLVVRTGLEGRPDARELLRRVREATLGAYAHQDLPFERLVEELVPERSLSHTPFFQGTFSVQSAGGPALRLGEAALEPLYAGEGPAKFDLVFALADDGERVGGSLTYRTCLWEGSTVERMLEHFATLLEGMAEEPARAVAALPLLRPAERERLLAGLDEARRPYPAGLRVHDLFAAQTQRTPDAPAVRWRGGTTTYAELAAGAGRLAGWLRRQGVGPETRVGICLERTPELVAAMLAVLQAGGAYVPLDPAYPRERLGWMVEDAEVALVLTSTRLAGALPEGTRTVALDALRAEVEAKPAEAPESGALPENLSHVIFTSGSTGRPKGVMIRHSSVVVLLHWLRETVTDEERASVLFSTSVNFDVSVAEVFGTLCWGGKLVLVENALELAALPEPVAHASMVPTAAAELLRAGAIPQGLRTLNLGGEALPPELAQALYALGTVEKVGNLYGPTEDTTYSTYALVGRGSGGVSIGRPVANTRALVLDAELEPVPPGVTGELYLAGDGLARGYARRPDLTAERFLPDPFGPPGSRMYRVMDRVRRRPDGELECFGRTDGQVKVRGFRVELGEVEAALRAHPAVRDAAAALREDAPGGRGIVGYVVPAEGASAPSAAELRAWLRERLPEHVVPAAVVSLESLPLTPNGKLDRLALPAPGAQGDPAREHVPPRTSTEEAVAAVWAETLGIGRVGAHDNFFDLGGHSLLLVQVHARLQERFGASVSLAELFQFPTLAELARRLDQLREEPADAAEQHRATLDRAGDRRARMARRRTGRPAAAAPGEPDEDEE